MCTSYDKRFISSTKGLFVRRKVYHEQTPKHAQYFWAFDLGYILTHQINAFVYFVRQKVYSYDERLITIKPQNMHSIFGRLYSHTWLPNKRFCVLRTTKGLFVRRKVYSYDKRFITIKPQNIRSIFGRLYSHTWLPNKRFCVLRKTKGLSVRQKVYDQTPKHTQCFWAFVFTYPTTK